MLTKCLLMVLGICTQYAEARHGTYYHRHHHVHIRHVDTVHVHPDLSSVKEDWPFVQTTIEYPGVTGTSVLDGWSGREPVISRADCANPTVDWYKVRHEWGWLHHD